MFLTSHLHPMIVHFPIVLVTIGFLADLLSLFLKKEICLSKIGFYLMIIGTLAVVAAVITGKFFTNNLSGQAGEMKETHELLATITMWVLIAGSSLRIYLVYMKIYESGLKWIVLLFYTAAAVGIGVTGFLGGNLVYQYMIGI